MPAGFRAREILGTMRHAQSSAASTAPIVVLGPLADELVRELRVGSDDSRAVAVGGDPEHAAVVVVVLAGAPGAAEERVLREATRKGTPVLGVQTDTRERISLPYVVSTEIVDCLPGRGFPIPEIAAALARRLDHDGVSLAARLPTLRDAVCHSLIAAASRQAGVVGIVPWPRVPHLPAMTLIQTRLVLDLAAAHGQAIDRDRGPEVAAVAGAGLGLRGLARRLPSWIPLVGGVTGYLGTRAIGEAAHRRYSGEAAPATTESVRPGT